MNSKISTFLTLTVVMVAALVGCQSSNELPPISTIKPSVSAAGTLANTKLVSDTHTALEKMTGSSINIAHLLQFVIQQPVGKPGSRAWREMWFIKSPGSAQQFLITFREAGLDAANFDIKRIK